MRKTKIVCTLGPASSSYSQITGLIKAGMNVARLNMSHGNLSAHKQIVDNIKKARNETKIPCSIIVDTKGPEMRIGKFAESKIELEKGDIFTFTEKDVLGSKQVAPLKYKGLVEDIKIGSKIFVNNGLVEFKVLSKTKTDIKTRVINGGVISDNKSMNAPGVKIKAPYLSEKDKEDIIFAIKNDVEFIAISFVSNASEVKLVNEFVKQNGGTQKIISKIENNAGIKNIIEIILASDGIMVARGDMGTEIPFEAIPYQQKRIIKETIARGKMVITATEMLESMTENLRPTRAETTDVANAIYDGTSATMLSGETAVGKFPIQTVKTMAKIARETEKVINYNKVFDNSFNYSGKIIDSISYSACQTAKSLKAKVIVCFTNSGTTARMLSRFRPQALILAVAHSQQVYQSLALSWGVKPVIEDRVLSTDEMFNRAVSLVKELKLARKGDFIVITSGVPAKEMGTTNLIKITQV